MLALLRVLAVPLALGVGHGHVTTIHVGWPQAGGRMRTLRAAATTPGEAMPRPAAEPPLVYAPVPRDARAPTAFGIVSPAFPVRCWAHRTGNAVNSSPLSLPSPLSLSSFTVRP
ncbi:hypothetical protein [Streptomyces sp. CB03238]|uniref:hypothetical protein n=1 Tax=Streptomyces sp. CB03238 TaxID=1907777 RepID=UPI000A0F4577|nr:hypothetical protein [Streptomyces sp. CB03238]